MENNNATNTLIALTKTRISRLLYVLDYKKAKKCTDILHSLVNIKYLGVTIENMRKPFPFPGKK